MQISQKQSDMVLHNEQKLMSLLIYIAIIITTTKLMITLKSVSQVLSHDMMIPLALHLWTDHRFLGGISFDGTPAVA